MRTIGSDQVPLQREFPLPHSSQQVLLLVLDLQQQCWAQLVPLLGVWLDNHVHKTGLDQIIETDDLSKHSVIGRTAQLASEHHILETIVTDIKNNSLLMVSQDHAMVSVKGQSDRGQACFSEARTCTEAVTFPVMLKKSSHPCRCKNPTLICF